MKKALLKLWKGIKRHGPALCTGVAMTLTAMSSISTHKATIKAMELKKEAEELKGAPLTKKESVLVQAKPYVRSALWNAATIGFIFTSHYLDRKRQMELIASAAFVTELFNKYRRKGIEVYGEEFDKAVKEAIAEEAMANAESPSDGLMLFYDELTGDTFESTMEDVLIGLGEFERRICTYGDASVNEYREYLGMSLREDCYNVGWNVGSISEWTGEYWLDYGLDYDEKLKCTKICLAMSPMLDYENYDYGKMIFWPSMVDEDTYLKNIWDDCLREKNEPCNGKEVTA